jgi:hypothetical protein
MKPSMAAPTLAKMPGPEINSGKTIDIADAAVPLDRWPRPLEPFGSRRQT